MSTPARFSSFVSSPRGPSELIVAGHAAPTTGGPGRWALLGLAFALGCADSQPDDKDPSEDIEDTGVDAEDDGSDGSTETWDTGSVDDPLTCDPTEQTYVADVFDGVIVQPAGLGPMLADAWGSLEIAVHVDSMDDESADLMVGWGSHGEQERCLPTTDLDASVSGRRLSVTGASVALPNSGGETMPLFNVSLDAAVAEDCGDIELTRVTGELDSRDLGSDFVAMDNPDDVCRHLISFGMVCEPCTSDGEPYCVPVEVADLYASPASYTMEQRTDEDIAEEGVCSAVTSCSHAPAGRSGAWGLLGLGMLGLLLRRRR